MGNDEITARDERVMAAYERMDRLREGAWSGLFALPIVGTFLGQLARVICGPSLFSTAREDALSGVSNRRLFWTSVLALGATVFLFASFALYGVMAPALPEARQWIASVGLAVLIVLALPYLIEGLGLWLGTLGHAFGGSKRSLHAKLNKFHRPTQNFLSPRRRD